MSDPRADVEVISLLWRLLSDLTLPGLTLEINNLGFVDDRALYKPLLVVFLKGVESRLCANCQRRIEANPLRVLDCKVPECRQATDRRPSLDRFPFSGGPASFRTCHGGLGCDWDSFSIKSSACSRP